MLYTNKNSGYLFPALSAFMKTVSHIQLYAAIHFLIPSQKIQLLSNEHKMLRSMVLKQHLKNHLTL